MDVRATTEEIEADVLVPWATLSAKSRGRERPEEPDDLRTGFQRDRDRILHTKAFRRLKHKTQVFLSPEGDHYRTRLTHTLEVAQAARTICRALRLNEDLVEAICLGHDLGHTPFGHVGEEVLSQVMGRPFEHNRQSLRVVDRLEWDGRGLNLTWEVRDGILNHTWKMPEPASAEGMVARWSDRIAYVNHDVDDAVRAGVLVPEDLPRGVVETLGGSHGERLDRMIRGLVSGSGDAGGIRMPEPIAEAMLELRSFLFERVYLGPAREEAGRASHVLRDLFAHYLEHPEALPELAEGLEDDIEQRVADYVSGMTDRYAVRAFEELAVPRGER